MAFPRPCNRSMTQFPLGQAGLHMAASGVMNIWLRGFSLNSTSVEELFIRSSISMGKQYLGLTVISAIIAVLFKAGVIV